MKRTETIRWIDVDVKKPPCPRAADAFGTPVLIWPQNLIDIKAPQPFAYYGKRATGSPAFYLYGAEIHGVTHWAPLPSGPTR